MIAYPWARRGDINAFFGLMLDNLAVMIILVSAISLRPGEAFSADFPKFTADFVLSRMLPGTALGVLFGDLVYTWMAFRLARRSGRRDVTAMPLGLDTPSTFGVAFLILLPALKKGFGLYHGNPQRAMEFAWHVGLLTLVLIGVVKTVLAPFGNAVRRLVPRAGLLGSLAAIALALIAFLPLLLDGIAAVPIVGLLALAIILLTLVAHRELPYKFPGALAAVLIGVVVYWLGHGLDQLSGSTLVPKPEPGRAGTLWDPAALMSLYGANFGWWYDVFGYTLSRLPVALPFGLVTIVGGIDCTESAAAAGDEYDTRSILLTEGVASLCAGLLGGVIQTTPYIGHPAYKKMGGRSAYTLATALFVGVVGCVGGFTYLYAYLPRAAMFPILVFVGLEITAQSFHATPTKHYPAVAFAMLPALAYLITVVVKQLFGPAMPQDENGLVVFLTLRCLANGFLISGMLWAAALVMILDGKLPQAAGFFAVAGVCAFFGVIHSPLRDETIATPYPVLERLYAYRGDEADRETPRDLELKVYNAVRNQTPYHWAGAYGLVALLLLGLAALKPPRDELGEAFPAALPEEKKFAGEPGASATGAL
jgi:AGZA family xanthine/uracil permease-like MFS transporter